MYHIANKVITGTIWHTVKHCINKVIKIGDIVLKSVIFLAVFIDLFVITKKINKKTRCC